MLCQFSFKNFRSYKEETTFDFQAATLSEFSANVLNRENSNALLPVGVIYGPNGGGKSNLLSALGCLISTVVRPIHELEKNRISMIFQQRIACEPFLLDDVSNTEPTEFRIFFRTKGYEYLYYLAIFNGSVVGEALDRKILGAKKPAHLFDREDNEITLGASLGKSGINTSVNEKMPYLSFLAITYNLPAIVDVQEWFESCIIRNYANPMVEHQIMITENESEKAQMIGFMNDMGVDIEDYRFDEKEKQLYLSRENHGNHYELPFPAESEGTKKLIAALPVLMLALEEGRLVVIDELDAKLHPKLLKYIIALFKNMEINKKGAQLLFTSHDIATMKNTVFRRDEIWFAAENENHESEIYSLYEIRGEDGEHINRTAAYDKQYLEGRYGADPYLQNMLTGGGWK